jgi:hypothetical protein
MFAVEKCLSEGRFDEFELPARGIALSSFAPPSDDLRGRYTSPTDIEAACCRVLPARYPYVAN